MPVKSLTSPPAAPLLIPEQQGEPEKSSVPNDGASGVDFRWDGVVGHDVQLRPVGPAVYRCIAAVSAELAKVGIAKDRKNEQQGYKFRGIDEVLNALAPVLSKHGLVILPRMISREITERATRSGGVQFNVVVFAEFDFIAALDGSKHTVAMFGEAMDSADKATNKAMSAAYKYAAFQTFCIPLEGMAADADTVTPEESVQTVPKGYDDFRTDLESLAESDGLSAVSKAFKSASPEFRDYATKHDAEKWKALKVKAQATDTKKATAA